MPPDAADAPREDARPEGRGERMRRHERRAMLYVWAIVAIVILGLLIAWVAANRDEVEVEWLVGSTEAALALVIFVAAALGWALGIATAVVIRRRTKRSPG